MLSVDDNDRQMFKDKDERFKKQVAMNGVDADLTKSDKTSKEKGRGWDLDK